MCRHSWFFLGAIFDELYGRIFTYICDNLLYKSNLNTLFIFISISFLRRRNSWNMRHGSIHTNESTNPHDTNTNGYIRSFQQRRVTFANTVRVREYQPEQVYAATVYTRSTCGAYYIKRSVQPPCVVKKNVSWSPILVSFSVNPIYCKRRVWWQPDFEKLTRYIFELLCEIREYDILKKSSFRSTARRNSVCMTWWRQPEQSDNQARSNMDRVYWHTTYYRM